MLRRPEQLPKAGQIEAPLRAVPSGRFPWTHYGAIGNESFLTFPIRSLLLDAPIQAFWQPNIQYPVLRRFWDTAPSGSLIRQTRFEILIDQRMGWQIIGTSIDFSIRWL